MSAEQAQLIKDISDLQARVQAMEVQFALIAPAELLQFKGKVLQALETIDKDLDGIADEAKECGAKQELKYSEYDKKFTDLEIEMGKQDTRMKIYTALISSGITILFSIIIAAFF